MTNIELIFCKSNNILGAAIGLYTYGEWSHVAIMHAGIIVEASALHGVRVTTIENLKNGNSKVVGLTIECQSSDEGVQSIISAEVGKGYDWGFIFNAFFRINVWNDQNAWACSELGAYIVQKSGIKLFSESEKNITPTMLYTAVYPISKSSVVYK